jgi:hypothetical protein
MPHQPARRVQQHVLALFQRSYAEVDRALYRFHAAFIEFGEHRDPQSAEQPREFPDDGQVDLIFERQRPDAEFPVEVGENDDGIDQGRGGSA